MFDMLLESGHRRLLVPSWGRGVAVTLHVLILGALWRGPASPAHVSTLPAVDLLPPVDPTPNHNEGGPFVPIVVSDPGPFPLPPLEIPQDILKTLRTPVIEGNGVRSAGGPTLEPVGGVYVPALVQEPPELLTAPMPVYPPLLRGAGIQGRVIVSAVVDTLGQAESGSVRIVLSDNPGFDVSALAAVRAARFRPARVYGRAVRVLVQVPVVFRLN